MTQVTSALIESTSAGDEVLVRVEGVSKKFCRSLKKSLWYGVQDIASELVGRRYEHELRLDEFWAINDVSFELKRGECLGLIGRNGAGKTTLLRMLNGLIKPDKGRIEMRGRVNALIALGAGFNPILTGRENIYVNASILGLSKKEIDEKIEEIIDFAEIDEFIDTPVQNYSSGMQVRLGFAVATTLEPDILILDEVLAVGDINFQIKCGRRIRELSSQAAVIFVSHSMYYVSWFCSRVIVLGNGCILQDALNPADGIQTYLSMTEIKEEISGTGDANINDFQMVSDSGISFSESPILSHGECVTVKFTVDLNAPQKTAKIVLSILDESNTGIIYYSVKDAVGNDLIFVEGKHRLNVPIGMLDLNGGRYSFLVAIVDSETNSVLLRQQGIYPFQIGGATFTNAKIVRQTISMIL